MIRYFLPLISLLFAQTAICEGVSWEWVQKSKGKDTNSIVWNLKKLNFFDSELPNFKEDFGFEKKHKKSTLSAALTTVLGGAPEDSTSPDENSIVLTACRSHSCEEKGFYWANSKDQTSIMAMVHYIFQGKYEDSPQLFLASKNFKCGNYPEVVTNQIKSWLKSKNLDPKRIRCLQDNKVGEGKL